jgi:hypothetical protein
VKARFVHVGFNVHGPAVPVAELKKVFSTALDWLRYDPHCWILYTTTDLDIWRDRIRNVPGIKPSDGFFLCEININVRSGYLGKFAWDWLRKDRTK